MDIGRERKREKKKLYRQRKENSFCVCVRRDRRGT